MSSDSENDWEEELGLCKDFVVDTSKAKYVIEHMLGEGGFGAVFKVHLQNDKEKVFAMKAEKKLETRRHSKLKMEIAILKILARASVQERSHFTQIIDRGKKQKYFFIIMQMVGKCIADLKVQRPERVFSMGTGLGVSMQCLEAVEDLHRTYFIHRDLKPANYASGIGDNKHMVYLLDFGIARKIVSPSNDLKTPRRSVPFKGTVRFASLACHKNQEMSYKDDCESWYYLMIDLIQPNGLPWKRLSQKEEVKRAKEKSRNELSAEFYKNIKCSTELNKALLYIDDLKYFDKVDYSFIYSIVRRAAESCDADLNAPYDWEEESSSKQLSLSSSVKKERKPEPDKQPPVPESPKQSEREKLPVAESPRRSEREVASVRPSMKMSIRESSKKETKREKKPSLPVKKDSLRESNSTRKSAKK